MIENYFGKIKVKFTKILGCEYITDMNTVTNFDQVSKVIKNEMSTMKLLLNKVSYTVQNKYIINRNIEIINTNHRQDILGLIKYELIQYMPIDIEEYIIKYKVLEVFPEKINAQVILMPKTIKNNYKELSKHLKLKPIKLGVNFNILQNLIEKDMLDINNELNIILDIKKDRSNLNIIKNKSIIRSHTINNEDIFGFISKNVSDVNNIYYYGIETKNVINILNENYKIEKLNINNSDFQTQGDLNRFISNVGLIY